MNFRWLKRLVYSACYSMIAAMLGATKGVLSSAIGAAVSGRPVSENAALTGMGCATVAGGTTFIVSNFMLNGIRIRTLGEYNDFLSLAMLDLCVEALGALVGHGLRRYANTSSSVNSEYIMADVATGIFITDVSIIFAYACFGLCTINRVPNLHVNQERELPFLALPTKRDIFLQSCSEHLRAFIQLSENNLTLREKIQALGLKRAEKARFEKFRDPITEQYIDLPVYLNDKFYNLETLLREAELKNAFTDFYTREIYIPENVQSARSLLDEFETVAKQLYEERRKQAVLSRPRSKSDEHITFFSRQTTYSSTETRIDISRMQPS